MSWWNEENWNDVLPYHESWREFAEHCCTHDPLPQTPETQAFKLAHRLPLGAGMAQQGTCGTGGSIQKVIK